MGWQNLFATLLQAGNTTIINSQGVFVYAGTPANGNLIVSIGTSAGTDDFGNAFPQGLNVTQGVISGGTFIGNDFVINSNGAFFYSGTPANGNLLASISPTAGVDSFGNNYQSGFFIANSGQFYAGNTVIINQSGLFVYSGMPGAGAGTFTAVGGLIQSQSNTITVNPANVGDLILLHAISSDTGVPGFQPALSVSGGNCTWKKIGTTIESVNNVATGCTVFQGTAIATGSAVATISYALTPSIIRNAAQEYTSSTGMFSFVKQGTLDHASPGTNTMPALATSAGQLYSVFEFDSATASAGATPGFTYDIDSDGNGLCFNPNCGAGTQAPTFGSSTSLFGIAVIMSANSPGNLLASITPASGTDAFGNSYVAGIGVYGPTGAQIALEDMGTAAAIVMLAAGMTSNNVRAQVFAGSENAGAANEISALIMTSGKENSLDDAALQLFSESADGTIAANAVIEFGGTVFAQITKTGLVLPGNPTPSPIAGSMLLFADPKGSLRVVDGNDQATYAAERKTLFSNSNSGSLTALSTLVGPQNVGVGSYRVHAQLYLNVAVAGAEFNCQLTLPAGSTGQVGYTISRSTTFVGAVAGGVNTPVGAAVSLGTANGYIVQLDALFTNINSGTLSFQVGSLTATGLVVAAFSFFEIMPV